MTSFLFWNIHNNDKAVLTDALVSMVHERRIDVLILAECPKKFKNAGLLPALNRQGVNYYYSPPASGGYANLIIYTRYASEVTSIPDTDGTRFTFRKIEFLGDKQPVLLAVCRGEGFEKRYRASLPA